jgi:protein phosphatase
VRICLSDDETNQDVSADAFDLVREIAGKRLKHRKLTVIDATNVRAADRKAWVELARKWHALLIAIVIDPGVEVCVARNALRPDRDFGAGVPKRMAMEIRKGMGLAFGSLRPHVAMRPPSKRRANSTPSACAASGRVVRSP